MEHRTVQKGDVIFRENDVEFCLYDITAGKVGIYANYGTETEKLLTELSAGDFFGEMGLIDQMPRSATAVCLEDGTSLDRVNEDLFQEFLEGDQEKVLKIIQNMSGRIRALTGDYLEACRIVAEAAAADENCKKKGGWFKSSMKKFVDDYNRSYDRYFLYRSYI